MLRRSRLFQLLILFLAASPANAQDYHLSNSAGLADHFLANTLTYSQLYFDLYSARVDNDAAERLNDMQMKLRQDVRNTLVVMGFRSNSEAPGLSLTRARNVKRYLSTCFKVDPNVVSILDYGNTCPHWIVVGKGKRKRAVLNNARVIVCILPPSATLEDTEAVIRCSPNATPRTLTQAPARVKYEDPAPCPKGKKKGHGRHGHMPRSMRIGKPVPL